MLHAGFGFLCSYDMFMLVTGVQNDQWCLSFGRSMGTILWEFVNAVKFVATYTSMWSFTHFSSLSLFVHDFERFSGMLGAHLSEIKVGSMDKAFIHTLCE
jgi:hypothetical protein